MFYGTNIKPGSTVKLNADGGEVLHISGACLVNPTSDERTYLVLHHEDKNHILCCLKKDLFENVALDIFIPTRSGATFKVQGKSEVHVIGYYEPLDSEDDELDADADGLLLDEEDESTQVSSDEEANISTTKPKKIQEVDDEGNPVDSDEDMNDIQDDVDDEDDEDDDDDDDDDDDEDQELRQALQQQLAKKAKSKRPEEKSKIIKNKHEPQHQTKDKKRKGDNVSAQPEKQQKTGGNPLQKFEKAITEYLKKHGRSLISQLASACPKPPVVTTKYREFLVSRPSIYVVEGQHAALKA